MKTSLTVWLSTSAAVIGLALAVAHAKPDTRAKEGDITFEQQQSRMAKQFARLDVDRDGFLTVEEIQKEAGQKRTRRAGPGRGEARPMMTGRGVLARADRNGDKALSLDEMLAHAMERFEKHDGNGNGVLEESEIAKAADARRGQPRGEERNPPKTKEALIQQVTERFEKLDTNNDGLVTQADTQTRKADMKDHVKAVRDARFTNMDTNRDDRISEAEYLSHAADRFAKADKNGDRVLSKEERDSDRPSRRPQRG